MVKRYSVDSWGKPSLSEKGDLVYYSDYLTLKVALREALGGWEFWHNPIGPQRRRIAELRKLLDD